jgi:hypothetical protein
MFYALLGHLHATAAERVRAIRALAEEEDKAPSSTSA